MLVSGPKTPIATRNQPSKSSWAKRILLTSALATIALGGCSLALDFDAPLSPEDDGGGIDGTVAIDGMAQPDATPVVTCNASDTALENNNTRATATAIDLEIMSVLCSENAAQQDVDYFQFLIGLNVSEDITINLSQRNGERVGMRLRDSVGTTLELAAGTETVNTIERFQSGGQLLPPGTYYIEVFYPTVSSPKAEYTLTLDRLAVM